MFSPPRQRFVSFYALLVVGWICLFVAGLGFVVGRSLKQVEKDFIGESEQSVATLRDRLRANEAVLAGFAVFLGANGNADRAATQRYAQAVLNHYPQIHLLEVAQRVNREERARLERELGKRWLPGFAVRTFGALPGRAEDKPEYFPLVLIAPDLPAAQETYGLDLESVPHLRTAMRDAFNWRKPVSSNPFPLAEGGDAYVLFHAVDAMPEAPAGEPLLALLVVRSESLRPLGLGAQYEYAARIYRGEATTEAPKLFAQAAAPVGDLESLLLPRYRIETAEFSNSQPIHLEVARQVRWADIPLDDLWRVSALALCGLALLVHYIRQHRAESLALHDSLTHLPNRTPVAERVAPGDAICPRGDNDEVLIRQADQAMCRVKDNGRNAVSALIEKTT
jgi:diguanylate cyclase